MQDEWLLAVPERSLSGCGLAPEGGFDGCVRASWAYYYPSTVSKVIIVRDKHGRRSDGGNNGPTRITDVQIRI